MNPVLGRVLFVEMFSIYPIRASLDSGSRNKATTKQAHKHDKTRFHSQDSFRSLSRVDSRSRRCIEVGRTARNRIFRRETTLFKSDGVKMVRILQFMACESIYVHAQALRERPGVFTAVCCELILKAFCDVLRATAPA
jgi:hypothetical protein